MYRISGGLMTKSLLLIIISLHLVTCKKTIADKTELSASEQVLSRIIGPENMDRFKLSLDTSLVQDYIIQVNNNKVEIQASSPVALCRASYDYLKNACHSIVSWSGDKIDIPEILPEYSRELTSPFDHHFYFNVVTHGYSTAYWDWERWEREIDWMAMHGMDMPLLPGAHEAILLRVFKALNLTEEDIRSYFTGPAHFPWNKMGNITGWDGDIPASFFEKQIQLNHKILDRMHELEMNPIVPAFAGFVPSGIQKLYPDEKVRSLTWGGFPKNYQATILEPGSDLFIKIGKMYVQEYEKEFGKQGFYLADSFNEMDVPLSEDPNMALEELANYGSSVYRSIEEANPDAVWTMMGWTFPYQKKDGKIFWTPERLQALISKVPDDKLMILDLANEYNKLWWNIDPSWKIYDGFFNKMWIYSFIPNMGGKTAWNGRLDLYASMAFEALNYPEKGNMVGFGFAPEGIENNEMVYELLADVAWSDQAIDLTKWIRQYANCRYGGYPENMAKAFEFINRSCYGSFTDHPRNSYQFRPNTNYKGSIDRSEEFEKGVELFLSTSSIFNNSPLYQVDAIELTCQYLGIQADKKLEDFWANGEQNMDLFQEALDILADIDRLLESHPNWKLVDWTEYARNWGDTPEEKDYYAANAKRLITTWGGGVNEYAARTWSGLIRDYYVPRWRLFHEATREDLSFDMLAWEENWITSSESSAIEAFENPLDMTIKLFHEQKNEKGSLLNQ